MGLFRRNESASHLLGDQGMIRGQTLQYSATKQISAAVAHMYQAQRRIFQPGSNDGGAHTTKLQVIERCLIDVAIGETNGVSQALRLFGVIPALNIIVSCRGLV